MLKLEKPLMVNGISVYPDHQDPELFYYLPYPVSLADQQNSKDKNFHLWMYRSDGGHHELDAGGFLNFQVNLSLGKTLENDILSKLKENGIKNPRLTTPIWSEGKVHCIGLDIDAETKKFVTRVSDHATPSLIGDNDAIFSLSLSKNGAILAKNAFSQKSAPIGVIYELKYTALRPALHVRVSGSYEQIYNHFSTSLSGQYEFIKADIDAGFEKLVKNNVINIEVENYIPDHEKDEQEQWALEFFKAQIVSKWFEPTYTAEDFKASFAKAEDIDDVKKRGEKPPEKEIKETTEELVAAATGMPIASFSLKAIRKEELGSFDLNFNSASAETRTCAPQGFLGLCVKDLFEKQYISEIDLNDPFFDSMDITVYAPYDYSQYSLSSAAVAISYNHKASDPMIFDEKSNQPITYTTFLENKERSYTYDLNFSFIPDENWDYEICNYNFKDISSVANIIHIQPHEYIYFKTVAVSVSKSVYAIKDMDYIEVVCNYQSPKGWKAKQKTFTFTKEQAEVKLWRLRMGKQAELKDPNDKMYSYQIHYYFTNGQKISTEIMKQDASEILVNTPTEFPSVIFACDDIPWDEIRKIHVYVKTEMHEYHLEFGKSDCDEEEIYLDHIDQKEYSWRAIIYYKNKKTVYYPAQIEGQEIAWEKQNVLNMPQIYLDDYIS